MQEKLDFCRRQYAARGSTCGFRLSDLPAHNELQAILMDHGYVEENPNLVMHRASTGAPDAEIVLMELDEWQETTYRIDPVDEPNLRVWDRKVLSRVVIPGRFAVVMYGGDACAYGRSARQGDLLCVEDLWTAPGLRGRGLGTKLVHGLLRLSKADGASFAYITVNESNTGARRLDERLRFENIYRYRYVIPMSDTAAE